MTPTASPRSADIGSMLWVLLALTAATVEPILVKFGYRGSATAAQLLVYRTLFAGVAMLAITRRFVWIGRAALPSVASVSLLLLCTNGLTLLALRSLSAVTVISVVKITPALVAIINHARGRESLSIKFWLGFLLCFAGATMTLGTKELASLGEKGSFELVGVLAIGGAIVSSAVYRTRLEVVLAKLEPAVVSTYIFAINALLTVFALPFVGSIPKTALPISAFIGIAAAVANVAFLAAIRIFGSTRMSIIDLLQRPLVILGAVALLHEPLTFLQGAGVFVLLAGVHLAQVRPRRT
jgi:drug/metabolite transporter (DMT)-like permease